MSQLTDNLNLLTGELDKQKEATRNATATIAALKSKINSNADSTSTLQQNFSQIAANFDEMQNDTDSLINRFNGLDRGLESRFDDLDMYIRGLGRDLTQDVNEMIEEVIIAATED